MFVSVMLSCPPVIRISVWINMNLKCFLKSQMIHPVLSKQLRIFIIQTLFLFKICLPSHSLVWSHSKNKKKNDTKIVIYSQWLVESELYLPVRLKKTTSWLSQSIILWNRLMNLFKEICKQEMEKKNTSTILHCKVEITWRVLFC